MAITQQLTQYFFKPNETLIKKAKDMGIGTLLAESVTGQNILLIGSDGVGKTSIINQFVIGFPYDMEFSAPTSLYVAKDQELFKLKLIEIHMKPDIAGSRTFLDVHGIILIYDTTNLSSLRELRSVWQDICKIAAHSRFVLCGAKCDLPNRQVSKEHADATAKAMNMPHYEVSVKCPEMVELLMADLVKRMSTEPLEEKSKEKSLLNRFKDKIKKKPTK